MLPDHLYTKGVPGLGEALLADDYAAITNQQTADVLAAINARRLLGVQHKGTWYVEASAFCQDALQALHNCKRDQNRTRDAEQERQRREGERARQEQERQRAEHARDRERHANPPETDLGKKYGKTLGLSGQVTREDVKRRWRDLSMQYHPDKVQHLGTKLREVAEQEMKSLNEAYEYFKKKYDI